ncbi:MAG: FecR domain-containing protein, partial [Chloroflexota bacterium]|nr:FecR domain-containing protein [Chloroflexota bacterium]
MSTETAELAAVLDECIERVHNGESIHVCLADYPEFRAQIEPLLNMALLVSDVPEVSPSEEFRRDAKARLMMRIRQSQIETGRPRRGMSWLSELALAWQGLRQRLARTSTVAVPVALSMLLALGVSLPVLGVLKVLPPPALAAQCTLSVLGGSIEVQYPGSTSRQPGVDGMTLLAGTRIKTSADSYAVLTFFEGSTIKLEPNTDLEIRRLEYSSQPSTTIILKQWVGRTWSRVVQLVDPGSRYEIETPSATAVVRGTLFATEVDNAGLTRVATTEGVVGVVAQGEEVRLPASQETLVASGSAPSPPAAVPEAPAQLLVSVDAPVVASVRDPTGASTGYLPDGVAFNQILGSQSSSPAKGAQQISVAQPVSGEYVVALRYVTDGTAQFSIQGKSGEKIFKQVTTHEGTAGSEWLVRINLQVEDGRIVDSQVSGVEPLSGAPEKVVKVTPPARASGPRAPTERDRERSGDKGQAGGKESPVNVNPSDQPGSSDAGKGQSDQQSGSDKEKGQSDQQSGNDKEKGQSDRQSGSDKEKGQSDRQSGSDKEKGQSDQQSG